MGNKELFDFYIKLDRSIFIDEEYKEFAKIDEPLPIGHQQTISQPSLVFEMTVQLDLEKGHRVLEIGTGSGYQTAFLAHFAQEVYTIEQIGELAQRAQQRLSKLGYTNIKYMVGDGSEGWPEHAPFDRIMVTAGAGKMPAELISQLKNGGKMVIPVGISGRQQLVLVKKDGKGNIEKESLGFVRFVPLVGKYQ